jgi:hypothetical protein
MTWRKRIAAARQRGGFTREDKDLAFNWVTCACGEQDPLIPRIYGCKPLDDQLDRLGYLFYDSVALSRFDRAEELLAQIEQRAAQLVAQARVSELEAEAAAAALEITMTEAKTIKLGKL